MSSRFHTFLTLRRFQVYFFNISKKLLSHRWQNRAHFSVDTSRNWRSGSPMWNNQNIRISAFLQNKIPKERTQTLTITIRDYSFLEQIWSPLVCWVGRTVFLFYSWYIFFSWRYSLDGTIITAHWNPQKWAFGCNVKQTSPGVLLFSAWYTTQVKVKGWEPKNGLRSGFLLRPGGFVASKLSFFLWSLCPSPLYIKWYIVYPSGRVTVVMFHEVSCCWIVHCPWVDCEIMFSQLVFEFLFPVPLGCFFIQSHHF